jgi:hypothetical protein
VIGGTVLIRYRGSMVLFWLVKFGMARGHLSGNV